MVAVAWEGMDKAPVGLHTVRRVAGDSAPQGHALYWVVDSRGRRGIRLDYRGSKWHKKIPEMEHLDVDQSPVKNDPYLAVFLPLEDVGLSQVFEVFATNLAQAVSSAPLDERAKVFVERLGEWKALLESGTSFDLPRARGLFAELIVFRDHVLPCLEEDAAVEGWIGPEKGNHDFSYGTVDIEVKSLKYGAKRRVKISSEDQLTWTNGTFYLLAVEVAEGSAEGVTLQELVEKIGATIKSPVVRQRLTEKVAMTGCIGSSIFLSNRFQCVRESLFYVGEGFPRIEPSSVPPEIDDVTYRVNLEKCAKFARATEELGDSLKSASVLNDIGGLK